MNTSEALGDVTRSTVGDITVGRVRDAAVDRYGRLLILDAQALALIVVDPSGRVTQRLGVYDDPDAVYNFPLNVSLTSTDTLGVFDEQGIVHIYAVQPDALHYVRSVTLGATIDGGCLLKDQIVTLGSRIESTATVHLFNSLGVRVRSFGTFYNTDSDLLRSQLSASLIECDDITATIFVKPLILPSLYRFSAEGALLWRSDFADVASMDVRLYADGRTSMGVPEGGFYHVALDMLHDNARGLLILQVGLVTYEGRRTGRGADSIFTVLIDPTNGEGRYVGPAIGRLYDMSEREIIYSMKGQFETLVRVPIGSS